MSRNVPNPGQQRSLTSYVPIDFLQLPVRARTRDEATRAIWLCDRLATLVDNQPHCVKNGKLLIFSLVEHVFTQVRAYTMLMDLGDDPAPMVLLVVVWQSSESCVLHRGRVFVSSVHIGSE